MLEAEIAAAASREVDGSIDTNGDGAEPSAPAALPADPEAHSRARQAPRARGIARWFDGGLWTVWMRSRQIALVDEIEMIRSTPIRGS